MPLDSVLVLVVGLMLYRAPVVMRQPAFAAQIVSWQQERSASNQPRGNRPFEERSATVSATDPVPHESESRDLLSVAEFARVPEAPPGSPPLMRSGQPLITKPTPAAAISSPFSDQPPHAPLPAPVSQVPPRGSAEPPATEVRNLPETARREPDQPLHPSAAAPVVGPGFVEEHSPLSVAASESVETKFGGVFYLINLGLFLNLYGDFTTPLRPGLALPIWDFLARVGLEIVGERLRADPLWDLLARLSGREPEMEPGAEFAAPDDWAIPEDWSVFEQETRADNALPAALPVGGGLTDWFERLMPYLRWRLLRALGLADPADLSRVLCEQPACVHVSETHADVTFSLARLPIQVRLAGLDRDPGWVPAAGRFIAFHYD